MTGIPNTSSASRFAGSVKKCPLSIMRPSGNAGGCAARYGSSDVRKCCSSSMELNEMLSFGMKIYSGRAPMGTLLILSKLTTRPSLSIIGGWSTKLELSKLYSFPSLLRKFGNCDGKTSSFPYKSTIPRGEQPR